MKSLVIAAGFFALASMAHAENFLSFGADGALTEAETRVGYGSKRMGFDLNGQQLVSHSCLRQADRIQCEFDSENNPLQGKNVTSTYRDMAVTVTHQAHGIELSFSQADPVSTEH